MEKKVMVSGIKPTGKLTLGNYLGAIKNFINYQNEYKMYVFIANLHALTVDNNPEELKKNTRDMIALYLALGLDPENTILFKQSDLPEHSEFGYIMACSSYMGELNRMTQYKDFVEKKKDKNIPTGIFLYPTLMAADILLYDADYVPVGIDQKQHVELARDIAARFNHKHGDIIKIPEILIPELGAKIYSLSEPTKKMSKSDTEDDKGCIYLLDEPSVARKKIMSAVTDTESVISYNKDTKPGISNLLTILSLLTDNSISELEKKYQGKLYGEFKKDVAGEVVKFLEDLQSRYREIITNDDFIDTVLIEGAAKAHRVAKAKLGIYKQAIGLD